MPMDGRIRCQVMKLNNTPCRNTCTKGAICEYHRFHPYKRRLGVIKETNQKHKHFICAREKRETHSDVKDKLQIAMNTRRVNGSSNFIALQIMVCMGLMMMLVIASAFYNTEYGKIVLKNVKTRELVNFLVEKWFVYKYLFIHSDMFKYICGMYNLFMNKHFWSDVNIAVGRDLFS